MKVTADTKTEYHVEFSDVGDLCRYISEHLDGTRKTTNQSGFDRRNAPGDINDGWLESRNMAHALELAQSPWNEGRERIESALQSLPLAVAIAPVSIPVPVFAEEGDEVAVDRFLDRESDCWVAFPQMEIQRASKIVRVSINHSESSDSRVENIMARGAVVVALVDALESSGYRCEIEVFKYNRSGEKSLRVGVMLKAADQPLEIDRCAFWLMHPSVNRRIFFAVAALGNPVGVWFNELGFPDPADQKRPDDEIHFKALTCGAGELAIKQARETIAALTGGN